MTNVRTPFLIHWLSFLYVQRKNDKALDTKLELFLHIDLKSEIISTIIGQFIYRIWLHMKRIIFYPKYFKHSPV